MPCWYPHCRRGNSRRNKTNDPKKEKNKRQFEICNSNNRAERFWYPRRPNCKRCNNCKNFLSMRIEWDDVHPSKRICKNCVRGFVPNPKLYRINDKFNKITTIINQINSELPKNKKNYQKMLCEINKQNRKKVVLETIIKSIETTRERERDIYIEKEREIEREKEREQRYGEKEREILRKIQW